MHRILVVNNDFDTMDLIKLWLEGKNYKVKYTGDEDEVDDIINDFKPQLLLIDVLKESVIKKIKHTEEHKTIPIILMTGYTISKQDYDSKNVDAIIEKPFDPVMLEQAIKKCLKNAA